MKVARIKHSQLSRALTESNALFHLQRRIRRKAVACHGLDLLASSLDREALTYSREAIRLRKEIRRLKWRAFLARVREAFRIPQFALRNSA